MAVGGSEIGRQVRYRVRHRVVRSVGVVALVLASVGVACSGTATAASKPLSDPSVYTRDQLADIKGLQPDFWPHPADNASGLGTVSMNFFWVQWEPVHKPGPCASVSEQEYDGYCFVVPAATDAQVMQYSALGVPTTAIFYGTPSWARGARPCSPAAPGYEVFCVQDDPADYARFVGMVAQRYDGAHGHGRVSDFVIENEVNSNDWFDIGCGQGTACPIDDWVNTYAATYNAAYDKIRSAQPKAPVLISFEHHFAKALDAPGAYSPVLSVQTFLERLVPRLGPREWQIAIHPYPINLFDPRFGPFDLPYVTFGNLGVLAGWLRAQFPRAPKAWDIQLTEVGLNNAGNIDAKQQAALCAAFRDVLATPGVTSFIYHRLSDQSDEGGLALGLRKRDGTPKPAWTTWRDANDPANPTCGFENGTHTVVRRGRNPANGTMLVSSRLLPTNYFEQAGPWILDRREGPGTAMLFECGDGKTMSYLDRDVACRGATPMGPVGAIRTHPAVGDTGLYRCDDSAAHPAETHPTCPPGRQTLLGYVSDPTPPPSSTTTTTTVTAPMTTAITTRQTVVAEPTTSPIPSALAAAVVAAPALTG